MRLAIALLGVLGATQAPDLATWLACVELSWLALALHSPAEVRQRSALLGAAHALVVVSLGVLAGPTQPAGPTGADLFVGIWICCIAARTFAHHRSAPAVHALLPLAGTLPLLRGMALLGLGSASGFVETPLIAGCIALSIAALLPGPPLARAGAALQAAWWLSVVCGATPAPLAAVVWVLAVAATRRPPGGLLHALGWVAVAGLLPGGALSARWAVLPQAWDAGLSGLAALVAACSVPIAIAGLSRAATPTPQGLSPR
ncbi:MAG: hypothetical protein H6739_04045 [Alphaproteobacteria bacterium]|nr:hypothetical protein [Alphaproteobacteria bacterium]